MNIKTIAACMFLLLSIESIAQQKQKLNLDAATVYLTAAEITSSTKINLPQGESEVIFTNVAGNIQKPTLQIDASNNATVESAEIKNDYLQDDNLSPAAKIIKDSIDALQKQIDALKTKSDVLDAALNVLKANMQIGGANTGVNVTELQKMVDYTSAKSENIFTQKKYHRNTIRFT